MWIPPFIVNMMLRQTVPDAALCVHGIKAEALPSDSAEGIPCAVILKAYAHARDGSPLLIHLIVPREDAGELSAQLISADLQLEHTEG